MAAEIRLFPCLTDNFGYLIHDPRTKATASIDAPEAGPVVQALEREGWRLTDILITHHHGDHTGGNQKLLAQNAEILIHKNARANMVRMKQPGIPRISFGDETSVYLGDKEVQARHFGTTSPRRSQTSMSASARATL